VADTGRHWCPDWERPLPPSPDPAHNDSLYWNFFDSRSCIGGILRVGLRPHRGQAETTFCLFLGDGSCLLHFQRWTSGPLTAFHAGGAKFTTLMAGASFRATFRGQALRLPDPWRWAAEGYPLTGPQVDVLLEMDAWATGPPFPVPVLAPGLADAHWEQPLAFKGRLVLHGHSQALEGFGMRDRSWGPRRWEAVPPYQALTCTFGPHLTVMAHVAPGARFGAVHFNGELLSTEHVEARWGPRTKPRDRRWVRFVLHTAGGPVTVEGMVAAHLPTRFSGGQVTVVVAMARYRCLGREGLGLYEYVLRLP